MTNEPAHPAACLQQGGGFSYGGIFAFATSRPSKSVCGGFVEPIVEGIVQAAQEVLVTSGREVASNAFFVRVLGSFDSLVAKRMRRAV